MPRTRTIIEAFVRGIESTGRLSVVALFAVSICACKQGQDPFRQVQFCLTERAGTAEFKRTMQAIAAEERMQFVDRSEEAEAELRSMQNPPKNVVRSFPLIQVSAENSDFGFGASNAGLGTDQVVIGFYSPETPASKAFAERTINRLQRSWNVIDVPNTRGALPLDCTP